MQFEDSFYGKNGFHIWVWLVSCVGIWYAFFVLLGKDINGGLVVLLFFIGGLAYLSSKFLFNAKKTAKRIVINGDIIEIYFYLWGCKKINFSEINSIDIFTKKYTLLKEFWPEDVRNIKIRVLNKGLIYINGTISDYEKLIEKLK